LTFGHVRMTGTGVPTPVDVVETVPMAIPLRVALAAAVVAMLPDVVARYRVTPGCVEPEAFTLKVLLTPPPPPCTGTQP
jgi:hypothetical protein